MNSKFKNFIESNELFNSGTLVLIAVSGGVDSVVLVNLFSKLKMPFALAHANFQLREKESDGDEKFVKELAATLNVNCFTERFATREVAQLEKISIQMAARKLRYDWLESIRIKNGFHFIATAHHRDDSIETVLLNLIKGTGIKGLHGILPHQGNIIRPLLFAGKDEIKKYASDNKIEFREDSSNKKTDYERNKIRHKIIPLLEETNASFKVSFEKSIKHFIDTELLFDFCIRNIEQKLLKKEKKCLTILIPALLNFPAPITILFELLKDYGFEEKIIEQLFISFKSESGKEFFSSTHRIIKDRKKIFITSIESADSFVYLIEKKKSQSIEIGNRKIELLFKKTNSRKRNDTFELDADKILFPLLIRQWKHGDYFYPFGMKMKKKKLSNFFVDLKIPIHEKEQQWVLQDATDKIICIAGLRIDERFAVSNSTNSFLLIRITQ